MELSLCFPSMRVYYSSLHLHIHPYCSSQLCEDRWGFGALNGAALLHLPSAGVLLQDVGRLDNDMLTWNLTSSSVLKAIVVVTKKQSSGQISIIPYNSWTWMFQGILGWFPNNHQHLRWPTCGERSLNFSQKAESCFQDHQTLLLKDGGRPHFTTHHVEDKEKKSNAS